jgi:glycyl-tRNA synthetase beta chain
MIKRNLIIEIGLEELPSSYMDELNNLLDIQFSKFLTNSYLSYESYEINLTPRRIVFAVKNIDNEQNIQETEIKGPPKNVALSQDGSETKALIGFLERIGTDKWFIKSTPQGEYVFCYIKPEKKSTSEYFSLFFSEFILKIQYSKKMKWESYTFIRPIRWIVALLDEDLIDIEICGVKSSNISKGLHGFDDIKIDSFKDYFEKMLINNIVISSKDRREIINKGLQFEGREDIINENVNITEDPRCIKGILPDIYLELPQEVITAVIYGSLKSFPLFNNNIFKNEFIFIMNGPRDVELVKKGYEKVINAKLKDAKYFFELDKNTELIDRVKDLSKVVFIEKLGNLSEKVDRMIFIADLFSNIIDLEKLKQSIKLSKVDLTTKIVSELPELQGIMGSIYARMQGVDEEIVKSIYEHYMPKGEYDFLPSSLLGKILSIIDRIDTLAGAFSINIEISGSSDPLGLRRAMNGLIRILTDTYIEIDLKRVIEYGFEAYLKINNFALKENLTEGLTSFFNSRIKSLFSNSYKYDIINSVLNSDITNPNILKNKCDIITNDINQKSFKILCDSYTRIKNITKNVKIIEEIDENILVLPQEKKLLEKYKHVNSSYYKINNLDEKFELLKSFNEPVTNFFNDILIMCDDISLKNSRLSLIIKIRKIIGEFADFSQIIFEGGSV